MDSPCIASCKLNSDKICVGCFRHIDEIVDWNKKSDEAHAEIFKVIEQRKIAFAHDMQAQTEGANTVLSAITQQEWQQAKQRIAKSKI